MLYHPHKTQESEQNMSALSGYQRATRFLNTQEDCIREFLLKKLGRNVVVEVADYAFPEQEHIKTMNKLFDFINNTTEVKCYPTSLYSGRMFCYQNSRTNEFDDKIVKTNKYKIFCINTWIVSIDNSGYGLSIERVGNYKTPREAEWEPSMKKLNNKKFCNRLKTYTDNYLLSTKQQRTNKKLQSQCEILRILQEERMENYNESVITDMRIFKHIWSLPRKTTWKKNVLKSIGIKGYDAKRDQEFLKQAIYSDNVSVHVEDYIDTIFAGHIHNPVEYSKLGHRQSHFW